MGEMSEEDEDEYETTKSKYEAKFGEILAVEAEIGNAEDEGGREEG